MAKILKDARKDIIPLKSEYEKDKVLTDDDMDEEEEKEE